MKKELFTSVCVLSVAFCSAAQAFEKPNLSSLKGALPVANTTTEEKTSAQDVAFKKQFSATLVASQAKVAAAQKLAITAEKDLAKILLTSEELNNFQTQENEINSNKDLSSEEKSEALNKINKDMVDLMNTKLKAKDFDDTILTGTNLQNYKKSFLNLQIATNRLENVMNNLSPNFKKVLDGDVSIFSVKDQLKDSASITCNVKAKMMQQNSLLNKLKKINTKNSIYVEVPATEKVVYNRYGVVGSINYELDNANVKVESSYKDLINAFGLKNDIAKIKAEIENNPDLTRQEKDAQLHKVVTDTITKAVQEKTKADAEGKIEKLSAQQTTVVANSIANLTDAGIEYAALGINCTKLGMKIAKNPLIAAPLALEVGQLKYTAKELKNGASSMKNLSGQLMKLAKANNIKVKAPENKSSKTKGIKLPLNI